jgi:hypothetical protein
LRSHRWGALVVEVVFVVQQLVEMLLMMVAAFLSLIRDHAKQLQLVAAVSLTSVVVVGSAAAPFQEVEAVHLPCMKRAAQPSSWDVVVED